MPQTRRKTEFLASAMPRPQWFDFWLTAGGIDGIQKFAEESGVKNPSEYALDLKAYLFKNPGDERKFELLCKLRMIRSELERRTYESNRLGSSGLLQDQ